MILFSHCFLFLKLRFLKFDIVSDLGFSASDFQDNP